MIPFVVTDIEQVDLTLLLTGFVFGILYVSTNLYLLIKFVINLKKVIITLRKSANQLSPEKNLGFFEITLFIFAVSITVFGLLGHFCINVLMIIGPKTGFLTITNVEIAIWLKIFVDLVNLFVPFAISLSFTLLVSHLVNSANVTKSNDELMGLND